MSNKKVDECNFLLRNGSLTEKQVKQKTEYFQ